LLESTRSFTADSHLRIVVLAGGIGSRFWPASTPARPKQLLPLASDQPLILDTVQRAQAVVSDDRINILTGAHMAELFRPVLPDLGTDTYLLEPEAKGTAPVLAWAAHEAMKSDPDAVLVSLHADHRISPLDRFVELVRAAGQVAAEADLLLTVGVPPDRPETGYGYIGRGEVLEAPEGYDVHRVSRFAEKPDTTTAERYIADGYLWNSGIFVWRADRFLREVREHAPEIGALLPLLDRGSVSEFFGRAPYCSVDVAVLEKSNQVGTIAATFEWDDVGSWAALARTGRPDASENVIVGHGAVVDGAGNLIYAEGVPIVIDGLDGLVVVSTPNATLVTTRERAPHLKDTLDRLPTSIRKGEAPS
jgi:mannose-1-phosphate guanylyltransferase